MRVMQKKAGGDISRILLAVVLTGVIVFGHVLPVPAEDVTVEQLTGEAEPAGDTDEEGVVEEQQFEMESAMMMAAADPAPSESSAAASPQSAVNNFQFDPTSGSGMISLPLYMPPGRNGVKPGLSVTYSPRGGNGPLGVGWGISFGSIERSAKEGVPAYDDTDTFICQLNGGSMELVPIGNGYYRAKVEQAFMNFKKDGNIWTAKDRRGTTYYFGLAEQMDDASRLQEGDRVYRWRLSKVKDTLGNFYLIRYLENEAFEIYYTGEPGTDSSGYDTAEQELYARVTTELEEDERPDPLTSYRSGMPYRLAKRIRAINIYAADHLMRRYVFDYNQSARTGRSLLTTVTEYGSDGVTAMPSLTFTYQEEDPEYTVARIENPTSGDNLWRFRYNGGYDRGHDNYGPVPPGHMLPLSEPITQTSWSSGGGRWDQDGHGRLNLYGRQDTGYYFSSYLYVQDPKTVIISRQRDASNAGFWLNGNYSGRGVDGRWDLKAGYNLIEYADYHQHQSFWHKILTDIGSQVDLMNSVQVVIPQLAGDYNGDGLADVASFFASSGKVKVALSNGGAFLPKVTWLEGVAEDARPVLGDFNADGKADICFFDQTSGNWTVYTSNGEEFNAGTDWLSGFGAGDTPTAADFNGDGLVDAAVFHKGADRLEMRIALNNGSALVPVDHVHTISDAQAKGFIGDFNGDGLADMGGYNSNGTWYARLNTGGADKEMSEQYSLSDFINNMKAMSVVDINADGKTDIGYFDHVSGKGYYRLSQGDHFAESTTTGPVEFSSASSDSQIQSGDFNGDGILDFCVYNLVGQLQIAYSSGEAADLLVKTDNGIGGVTTLNYVPSTVFQHHYLPFVMPLVSSTTVSNSRDFELTTRYWYDGGLWKPEDREFYGFEKVRVYDPDDHYSETVFLQDSIYTRGRVSEQGQYLADGTPIVKTERSYLARQLFPEDAPDIKFVYNRSETIYEYNDDATDHRRTVKSYYYREDPQLGNLTGTSTLLWDTAASGDDYPKKRRVYYQYHNNTDPDIWLLGLPKQVEYQDTWTPYARTYFYYDGRTDIDALPIKGLLTRKAQWDGDDVEDDPYVEYVYDDWGNVIEEYDAEGNMKKFYYQDKYGLFPEAAKNAEGIYEHVTARFGSGSGNVGYEFEGRTGIFGQPAISYDKNGAPTRFAYDAFGRPVKVIGTNDSDDFPTVSYEYRFHNDHALKITRTRVDHGEGTVVETAEFTDGLGRSIQTKSPAHQDGVYLVSGMKDLDHKGRVLREYMPFAGNRSLDQVEDLRTGSPYTLYDYDERGRVAAVTNPDGTFRTTNYSIGEVETIDANGHKQRAYYDLLGRMVKREEYTGADGRCSVYPQEPYRLYATTEYAYDARDQLTRTRDAQGNETVITYDKLGRKTAMDDSDMGHWEYRYDNNGNMVWQKDARGREVNFEYDRIDRLKRKWDGDDIDVMYTYDDEDQSYSRGRLSYVEYGPAQGGDIAEFHYDNMGREVRSTKTIDNFEYDVRREYNALDAITNVSYPDGTRVFYKYDDAGRLKGIANDPELFNDAPEPLSKNDGGFWQDLREKTGHIFIGLLDSVMGVAPAYAEDSRQVELITPAAGSTIEEETLHLEWDEGVGVEYVYLFVGSRQGSSDIYGGVIRDHNTADIQNIWLDGNPIYVRIWSKMASGSWLYKDYQFGTIEVRSSREPATLLSPAEGSTIEAETMRLEIDPGKGVNRLYVYVGTRPGYADIYFQTATDQTAVDVSGIWLDGQPIYVRLYSYVGGRWKYNDYQFQTIDNGIERTPSELISPVEGTVINTQEIELTWSEGTGVDYNSVAVGDCPGSSSFYYKRTYNAETSAHVPFVLLNGEPVYVRVYSRMGRQWKYKDYRFETEDQGVELRKAELTAPEEGSQISTETVQFEWDPGEGAQYYYIYVGTQAGRTDIMYKFMNTDTQVEVTDIPLDGESIYVRLWTRLYTGWKYNDYTFDTVVPNAAPEVSVDAETVTAETGDMIEFDVVFTDENGDDLQLLRPLDSELPRGSNIEVVSIAAGEMTVRFRWRPNYYQTGEEQVHFRVSDGELAADQYVTVTVEQGALTEEPRVFIKDIQYNIHGQTTRIEYGNGTVTTYSYNDLNLRLERMYTQRADGEVLQDLSYEYDAVGNIVSITDAVNTGSQNFRYDAIGRLAAAEAPARYGVKRFRYDEIGNITEKDGKSYTYGENGAGPHAVTSLSDGSVFGYDANGSMVSRNDKGSGAVYTYDAENRLTDVAQSGQAQLSFFYDGDGGRTKKIVHGAMAGGDAPAMAFPELLGGAGEDDLVTHYVGSLYERSNISESRHIYAGDRRIASVTEGEVRFVFDDHLGSPNVITDETGQVLELMEYQPFGNFSRHDVTGQEELNVHKYFTGQTLDEESGLYYYNARYYDPGLGRFVSSDPTVQHPNDPQDLNRYAYCRNNPVNLIDPSGYGWLKDFFRKIDDIIDDGVEWLEKATGSEWYIEAEFGYSQSYQDFETLTHTTVKVGYTAITQPWQAGVGIYRWAFLDPRYRILEDRDGDFFESFIKDDDNLFVNGILNSEKYAFANGRKAYKKAAFKVAYNPSDGALADLVESALQKLTFTSAFDRQLTRDLSGHKGITLAGHSQGGIIIGNTLLNLGIRDQRNVVKEVIFHNTQISGPRAYLSAAIAGINSNYVTYGSRYFDPSNAAGPNLTQPLKFFSAIPGLWLPFGIRHHGID